MWCAAQPIFLFKHVGCIAVQNILSTLWWGNRASTYFLMKQPRPKRQRPAVVSFLKWQDPRSSALRLGLLLLDERHRPQDSSLPQQSTVRCGGFYLIHWPHCTISVEKLLPGVTHDTLVKLPCAALFTSRGAMGGLCRLNYTKNINCLIRCLSANALRNVS